MTRKRIMTDRALKNSGDLDALSFWENGLLPVVVQSAETRAVLMVAFANREALERSLDTGQMHFWSRSRQELWHKGATSGNVQDLVSLHMDCDQDTLLALVRSRGPACHTGETTCFGEISPEHGPDEAGHAPDEGASKGRTPPSLAEATLPGLWDILRERAELRPEGSYTVRLLDDENLRLKKLGEETAELLLALARQETERIPEEAADLLYHVLVAIMASGVTLEELLRELDTRKG